MENRLGVSKKEESGYEKEREVGGRDVFGVMGQFNALI
jgi:hypothetical protein